MPHCFTHRVERNIHHVARVAIGISLLHILLNKATISEMNMSQMSSKTASSCKTFRPP